MFLEVSCMALLNAQLPYKTNAKLASTVLCFVTPQDRKRQVSEADHLRSYARLSCDLCKITAQFLFWKIKSRAVLRRETERIEPTKPEKIG